MLLVGRTTGIVSGMHVDHNNVSRAATSIHDVLHRTLLRHTARVTLVRGRPSNGPRPDGSSRQLARLIEGTTRAVGVRLASRIVIASKDRCDFGSRKLLWVVRIASVLCRERGQSWRWLSTRYVCLLFADWYGDHCHSVWGPLPCVMAPFAPCYGSLCHLLWGRFPRKWERFPREIGHISPPSGYLFLV